MTEFTKARPVPTIGSPALRPILALRVLAIACVAAHGGETRVYRTVDAQGNLVYTDRGSEANASQTSVRFHEPSPEEVARLEKERQAAETRQMQETVNSSLRRAQELKSQQEKQAACERARTQYYSMKDAGRLYQRDAQGNRVYLSDADADAKREQARKIMEAACSR